MPRTGRAGRTRRRLLDAAAGPAFYAVVGVSGFVGFLTGDAVSRYGLGRVLLATLVSAALFGPG